MDILILSAVVFVIFLSVVMRIVNGYQRYESREKIVQNVNKSSTREPAVLDAYRAVTVRPGSNACGAVSQLGERRYLLAEAPQLPLQGCNVERCNCKYIRHADRRDLKRERRISPAAATMMYLQQGHADRRGKSGRRKRDWAMA